MRILIVEDEPKTGEYLRQGLSEAGFTVDLAQNGTDGLYLAEHGDYELLILDVMLPGLNGWQLLQALRLRGLQTPAMFLSARDQVEDRIKGLELGADDYLVKPFALKEVEARLLALQRRGMAPAAPAAPLAVGQLSFDPTAHEVRLAGQRLDLPPKALKLLAAMLPHPDRLFTRRELEIAVWGHEQEASDNLRSVLHTLRKALDGNSGVSIQNIHGLGYKLSVD